MVTAADQGANADGTFDVRFPKAMFDELREIDTRNATRSACAPRVASKSIRKK